MHYYKSTELADLYGVSRRTVTNWIKQTQEGKLDLELGEYNGEFYIIKSRLNQSRLDKIVDERQKYLNTRSRKQLTPDPKLFEIYSEEQIHDIIHSLTVNNELPLQYTYFDKGAQLWDGFRRRPEGRFDAPFLIQNNTSYINAILQSYEKVNIVDLGVGNGMGAKEILSYLKDSDKLNRYIGVDISPDMLDIADRNITQWFNGRIKIEKHIRDLSSGPFTELIAEPLDRTGKQSIINIVLMLGGAISNFSHPGVVLQNINRSMSKEDILACNFRINSKQVKNQLAFISKYQEQCGILLEALGITQDLYNVEIGFDEEKQIRFGRIRLKNSIQIDFQLPRGLWRVNLQKDDTVLIFRAHFNNSFTTPKELFYANGFNPLLTAQTLNHEGMLVIADTKK